MANPISVTLSSVGVSKAIALDWRPLVATSYSVTGSSSGTFATVVEATIDDVMLSSSPVWVTESSGIFTANSSIVSINKTISAVRLNSSALSSAVIVLRVLQGYAE